MQVPYVQDGLEAIPLHGGRRHAASAQQPAGGAAVACTWQRPVCMQVPALSQLLTDCEVSLSSKAAAGSLGDPSLAPGLSCSLVRGHMAVPSLAPARRPSAALASVNRDNVFKVCDQPHPLVVAKIVRSCAAADLDAAYDDLKVYSSHGHVAPNFAPIPMRNVARSKACAWTLAQGFALPCEATQSEQGNPPGRRDRDRLTVAVCARACSTCLTAATAQPTSSLRSSASRATPTSPSTPSSSSSRCIVFFLSFLWVARSPPPRSPSMQPCACLHCYSLLPAVISCTDAEREHIAAVCETSVECLTH